ncbi:hypothetical protein A3761_14275, partial [Oleiphilus sp. HI0123]
MRSVILPSAMSQNSSRFMPGSSRLVRSLSEMLQVEPQTHPENFSERLSKKIDFSGSVKLSDAQGMIRMIDRRVDAGLLSNDSDELAGQEALEKSQQAFVRVRKAISQSIESGFDPDKSVGRIKLPEWDEAFISAMREGQVDDKLLAKAAEPFSKFYRAQQSDMSAKVQGLRVYISEVLEKHSPELAKLVVLDKALDEALSVAARKQFLCVPTLLATYFRESFERPAGKNADLFETCALDENIKAFLAALKRLLMAELEARLQLVLGLIEALNETVQSA